MASPLFTAFIVLCWYGSNIAVILTNKILLTNFDFRGPVFLTLCHMITCSLLSFGASASRLVTVQRFASRQQMVKVVVLAVVFLLTIVLNNVSLRLIPVSFNQAIGATTPLFTALLGLLIFRQKETPRVYLTLLPIVCGIVMASGAEPLFNLVGFAACLASTATRALKSVLGGRLLSDPAEQMDSMSLLSHMATASVAFLIPLTLITEPHSLAQARELGQHWEFWLLLLLNSIVAYFANLTNFLVTKHTSALTLQVLGQAKGAVAVFISLLYFKNPATFNSLFGYAVTVTGVALYGQAKRAAGKQELLPKLEVKRSGF